VYAFSKYIEKYTHAWLQSRWSVKTRDRCMSSKFIRCYPSGGFMWCQLPNGKYIPPLPLNEYSGKKEKSLKKKILSDDLI